MSFSTQRKLNERWPGFEIADDIDTVHTEDTGIVHAGRSVTAMQYQARTNGATLKENHRVDKLTPDENGVVIETSKRKFHAKKVILAADAWVNKLLKSLGSEIPGMTVMQEQVTHFKPLDPERYEPKNFPVWIWDLLKKLTKFMDTIIPAHGPELRTVTCQYAITPDRQFIIGPLKKHPDIILAQGNGHAFKFAPAIGRVAAELAIDGKTTEDISLFTVPDPNSSNPRPAPPGGSKL
ncbi:hypothetical protein N7533_012776 [Penicillium manginii]|uniref:uncharacterized protein n=1 Tax=Penicillium manginii TaxID=203109 RepID=UPI0025486938|nr:uncharacterized protein N7533_012776 [Penicillium manginii]KAJ5739992.1 hypothetical protein N7533_012776 [Penicillium manginii]